jgi:hypothetical protein
MNALEFIYMQLKIVKTGRKKHRFSGSLQNIMLL